MDAKCKTLKEAFGSYSEEVISKLKPQDAAMANLGFISGACSLMELIASTIRDDSRSNEQRARALVDIHLEVDSLRAATLDSLTEILAAHTVGKAKAAAEQGAQS